MKTSRLSAGLAWLSLCLPSLVHSYPLDGAKESGIRRLLGYENDQKSAAKGIPRLPPGALLPQSDIKLRLTTAPDWDPGEKDPELQAALESVFKHRHPSYSVAVVDITDPAAVAWAGVREDNTFYPGSVGKVLVMIALFDGLKRAFPDPADRARVLRETMIEADAWAFTDSHTVPHFDPETGRNRNTPIAPDDRFTLAEWIDHMISPSANAAGSTVWKHAMLLAHFGADYPVTREREQEFLKLTAKPDLFSLSQTVIDQPLAAAGIDLEKIQQGTMFTSGGQSRVPGQASYASPHQLVRLLVRIEQGRMVDAWSSLEMKRFLYMTKKRYRYAYPDELARAAVFFKSGSLYECEKEEGFQCGKYRGNVRNEMNSIAIIESPAAEAKGQKRYLVALMSNVLRKNSAWDHARLAAAIEELIQTRQPVEVKEKGVSGTESDAGRAQ